MRGPFGIISAAEMIGIMIFGLYIIWVASVYALQKLANVFSNPQYTTTQQKWYVPIHFLHVYIYAIVSIWPNRQCSNVTMNFANQLLLKFV